MAQTSERTLEIITDSLAGGYPQLVVGTFQEASEIMNARRLEHDQKTMQELTKTHIYTANLFLARKINGNLEYGLSGRETFDGIAGQNIGEFSRQLIVSRFYKLTIEQIGALPNFTDIEWVDPSRLNLQSGPYDWDRNFVEIDTSDYFAEKLNPDQKRIAQKPYGSMERKQQGREYTDFGENMNMLNVAPKTTTRIYFPTPNYVEESIKEGEVLARASWLVGFGVDYTFLAYVSFVGVRNGLRGVRNIVAESDVPKVDYSSSGVRKRGVRNIVAESDVPKVGVDPIANAYKTILGANPDQALRAMTPEIATGLSGLVIRYLGNQQKP